MAPRLNARSARRALERAARRRGRIESGFITAGCGFTGCEATMPPAPSIEAASAMLRSHYATAHDGREP